MNPPTFEDIANQIRELGAEPRPARRSERRAKLCADMEAMESWIYEGCIAFASLKIAGECALTVYALADIRKDIDGAEWPNQCEDPAEHTRVFLASLKKAQKQNNRVIALARGA